jgi:hypothetical protein
VFCRLTEVRACRTPRQNLKLTYPAAWCGNQRAQCPLICLQQPGVTSLTTLDNECDPDTLIYSCVCDNGVAPNITQYSQTLPFYICQAWGTQCVTGCNGDNTCSDKCRYVTST